MVLCCVLSGKFPLGQLPSRATSLGLFAQLPSEARAGFPSWDCFERKRLAHTRRAVPGTQAAHCRRPDREHEGYHALFPCCGGIPAAPGRHAVGTALLGPSFEQHPRIL